MTSDLKALRRIFGPGFVVDQESLRTAESARRAHLIYERDTTSRTPVTKLEVTSLVTTGKAVSETVTDPAVTAGVTAGTTSLAEVATQVSKREVSTVVSTEGDDTQPLDLVSADLVDGWHSAVAGYAASHSEFTTDDVLVEAFFMMPAAVTRGDQMRCAEILRSLGYDRQQRRIDGLRQNLWFKPEPI